MTYTLLRVFYVIFLLVLISACKDSEKVDLLQTNTDLAESVVTDSSAAVEDKNYDHIKLNISNPWSFSIVKRKNDKGLLIAGISHDQNYLEIWSIDKTRNLQSLGRKDTGYHPDDVKWVDWNRDGNITELLVALEGKKEIQLWRYDDGGLHKEAAVKVEDAPQNIEIADLDLNGQLDIVIGPYSGERLTLLWGQGDFNFDYAYLEALPIPAYPILVDWNHDGLVDIIWSDWKAGSVEWAQNSGKREFSVHILQEKGPGAPRQVISNDLDKNGSIDLVATLEVGKAARIFYNNGEGKVQHIEDIPAPFSGYSAAAVTSYEQKPMLALSEADRVILALREGEGQWQFRQLPAVGLFLDLQFFDVDDDDMEDIILADSSGDNIEVVFGPLWNTAEELEF